MFLFKPRVVGEILEVEAELFTGLIDEGILAITPATLRQFVHHVETDEVSTYTYTFNLNNNKLP